MLSFQRGGPSGRASATGHGAGRTPGRGTAQPRQPVQQTSSRFKGNCLSLEGQIFDCSDYKQADKYQSTVKRISEYVGSEFKHGGDIRSSIVNEAKITVPLPISPMIMDPDAPTVPEKLLLMIFKGEVDAYIKRRAILDDNVQKAYSLILGQCTDLLQSKLKQQRQWLLTSLDQDAIALLALIKAITFKFEDQKFLPLALHQAKTSLYAFRQGNMSCHEYLQKFQNLVDVAVAYHDCDQNFPSRYPIFNTCSCTARCIDPGCS